MVRVNPPPDPVTVTVYVPAVVEELALKLRVDVPDPGAARLAGLKVAVTPAGMPDAASDTAEEKLPLMVEVTFVEALPPCAALTLAGEADKVKFAAVGVLTVYVELAEPVKLVAAALLADAVTV